MNSTKLLVFGRYSLSVDAVTSQSTAVTGTANASAAMTVSYINSGGSAQTAAGTASASGAYSVSVSNPQPGSTLWVQSAHDQIYARKSTAIGGGLQIYIGTTLVWDGATAPNTVSGISIARDSATGNVTITAAPGTYAGLTITGGTGLEKVILKSSTYNGNISFTGGGTLPAGVTNAAANHAGIANLSMDELDLDGSGQSYNLTATAYNGQDAGGNGYPGFYSSSTVTSTNVLNLTAKGSDGTTGNGGNGMEISGGQLTFSGYEPSVTLTGGNSTSGGSTNSGGNGLLLTGEAAVLSLQSNGTFTATGGNGPNGGSGIVTANVPAETSVANTINIGTAGSGGLTVHANGGTGSGGLGGAGILTNGSISIASGDSLLGTGGAGTTGGGAGIAAGTPVIISGVTWPAFGENGLAANAGGSIQGTGGNATVDGAGGAGIQSAALGIVGGVAYNGGPYTVTAEPVQRVTFTAPQSPTSGPTPQPPSSGSTSPGASETGTAGGGTANPRTGDDTNMLPWVILMVGSLLAVAIGAGYLLYRRRSKGKAPRPPHSKRDQ